MLCKRLYVYVSLCSQAEPCYKYSCQDQPEDQRGNKREWAPLLVQSYTVHPLLYSITHSFHLFSHFLFHLLISFHSFVRFIYSHSFVHPFFIISFLLSFDHSFVSRGPVNLSRWSLRVFKISPKAARVPWSSSREIWRPSLSKLSIIFIYLSYLFDSFHLYLQNLDPTQQAASQIIKGGSVSALTVRSTLGELLRFSASLTRLIHV